MVVGLVPLGIVAMSLDFVLLYFGVGALITAIAAALGGNAVVQAIVFALTSTALLLVRTVRIIPQAYACVVERLGK